MKEIKWYETIFIIILSVLFIYRYTHNKINLYIKLIIFLSIVLSLTNFIIIPFDIQESA